MKCDTCNNMTLERHEDYMNQPMWYYGKCSEGCEPLSTIGDRDCSKYMKGEPKKVDCRYVSDIEDESNRTKTKSDSD